jgi:hypothetical protein
MDYKGYLRNIAGIYAEAEVRIGKTNERSE